MWSMRSRLGRILLLELVAEHQLALGAPPLQRHSCLQPPYFEATSKLSPGIVTLTQESYMDN